MLYDGSSFISFGIDVNVYLHMSVNLFWNHIIFFYLLLSWHLCSVKNERVKAQKNAARVGAGAVVGARVYLGLILILMDYDLSCLVLLLNILVLISLRIHLFVEVFCVPSLSVILFFYPDCKFDHFGR